MSKKKKASTKQGISPIRLLIAAVLMLVTTGGFLAGMIWFLQQTNAAADLESVAGTVLSPPNHVRDIPLTDTNAEPVSLDVLDGKYTLLVFGYTHCPDVCPLTLTEFKRVKRELTATEAEQVNFAFISVDGERDTPELLGRYLERFDPAFVGMTTTDEDVLTMIKEDFGLLVERRVIEGTQAGYMVDHTATSFLLNPRGDIIVTYPFGTSPLAIAADLKALF